MSLRHNPLILRPLDLQSLRYLAGRALAQQPEAHANHAPAKSGVADAKAELEARSAARSAHVELALS